MPLYSAGSIIKPTRVLVCQLVYCASNWWG